MPRPDEGPHPDPGGAAADGPDPDGDIVPDAAPIRLRRELRRRVRADHVDPRAGAVPPGGRGRHARPDSDASNPSLNYVPRHAIRTPGPSAVSETELTEQFPRVRQDPTEPPMPSRRQPPDTTAPPAKPPPVRSLPVGARFARLTESTNPSKRVRVVLAQRKGVPIRPVRTVVDVQELTEVGEVLSSSLIRSQLALALRIGGIAMIALGSLPAIFVIFPVIGRFELFGIRLPWLLLGVLAYPFMVALGYLHARSSERLEQVFADHIQS